MAPALDMRTLEWKQTIEDTVKVVTESKNRRTFCYTVAFSNSNLFLRCIS
jgi:hypothetical protein